jgi:hypothetical protein
MGMLLSLVVGGMGFEAMGLSSEIGALVMGVLLSTHKRASELSESLWALKEVFLVGFFLQIGMSGLPNLAELTFALTMVLLLPLKAALFFFLLLGFKLRSRTSFLSALSLTAYSEFGLIVAAVIMPEWLIPLAVALAASFLIAAPLNRLAHPLFERWELRLQPFERSCMHPDEQPSDLDGAQVLIFGMGRTGTAAYEHLGMSGKQLIGLDADTYRAEAHRQAGRRVHFADAEDSNFWRGADLSSVECAILAMDDIEAKLIAARSLRRRGFSGPIISHALHEDHRARLIDAGATHTYLTMSQAGVGLAEQAMRALPADVEPMLEEGPFALPR